MSPDASSTVLSSEDDLSSREVLYCAPSSLSGSPIHSETRQELVPSVIFVKDVASSFSGRLADLKISSALWETEEETEQGLFQTSRARGNGHLSKGHYALSLTSSAASGSQETPTTPPDVIDTLQTIQVHDERCGREKSINNHADNVSSHPGDWPIPKLIAETRELESQLRSLILTQAGPFFPHDHAFLEAQTRFFARILRVRLHVGPEIWQHWRAWLDDVGRLTRLAYEDVPRPIACVLRAAFAFSKYGYKSAEYWTKELNFMELVSAWQVWEKWVWDEEAEALVPEKILDGFRVIESDSIMFGGKEAEGLIVYEGLVDLGCDHSDGLDAAKSK